jgi:hypothetical protein
MHKHLRSPPQLYTYEMACWQDKEAARKSAWRILLGIAGTVAAFIAIGWWLAVLR